MEAVAGSSNTAAKTYTFKELANATSNFLGDCLIGEGSRGRVYKGQLDEQVVAIKMVDPNDCDRKKFLVEVLVLSLLYHPNIVEIIGYYADGDLRLLVYKYMPLGSSKDYLLHVHMPFSIYLITSDEDMVYKFFHFLCRSFT